MGVEKLCTQLSSPPSFDTTWRQLFCWSIFDFKPPDETGYTHPQQWPVGILPFLSLSNTASMISLDACTQGGLGGWILGNWSPWNKSKPIVSPDWSLEPIYWFLISLHSTSEITLYSDIWGNYAGGLTFVKISIVPKHPNTQPQHYKQGWLGDQSHRRPLMIHWREIQPKESIQSNCCLWLILRSNVSGLN